jgi:hypothetical protein
VGTLKGLERDNGIKRIDEFFARIDVSHDPVYRDAKRRCLHGLLLPPAIQSV